MRNPFSRNSQQGGQAKVSAHPVNGSKLRERMLAWMEANDRDVHDPATLTETNKVILELAVEAELDESAQTEEGDWVLFIVDEDGFVMNQDRKYLMPEDQRRGNAWAYVDDDIAFAFSQRFESD